MACCCRRRRRRPPTPTISFPTFPLRRSSTMGSDCGPVNFDKCNGCGDCIAVCPSHAIEMVPVLEAYG
ncbi:4Fe-4S binding protein [bacterium]|nr:4Fe-4S binding protein [bacterium]